MITTKALVLVFVCLCLPAVHSSKADGGNQPQGDDVLARLKRVLQSQQAARTHEVEISHAEAQSAQAIRQAYESQSPYTPSSHVSASQQQLTTAAKPAVVAIDSAQRLRELAHIEAERSTQSQALARMEEAERVHNQVLAHNRQRQKELRSMEFEHEINLARLERQRDMILRHVAAVAAQLAAQQDNSTELSSSTAEVAVSSSTAEVAVSSSTAEAFSSSEPAPVASSSSEPAAPGVGSSSAEAVSSSTAEEAVSSSTAETFSSSEPAAPVAFSSSEPAAPGVASSSAEALSSSEPAAPVAFSSSEPAAPVAFSSSEPAAPVAFSSSAPAAPGVASSSAEPVVGGGSSAPVIGGGSSSVPVIGGGSSAGGNNTTEPVAKFVPGFVDHDPFAQGAPFQSDGTANDNVDWPSPIVDESDDIDVLATAQPTGGYYTPEIRPPEPDTSVVSASATSTGRLVWTPADTISTLDATGGESVIDWRWKQKLRGKLRQTEHDRLQPTDEDGNIFSLLQTNEFSSQNLAKEQADLMADIKHMEQTEPRWLK